MRVTYSYESILRAVGRMLDREGVHHLTLHEMADGLLVEGVTRDHEPYRHTFTLDDLCQLIDRLEGHVETLFPAIPTVEEAHALREFLARHEAVAAR